MKSLVCTALIPLAAIWIGSVSAELAPVQKLDDHGRVILDEGSDGRKTIHTYAPGGEQVKSENSGGERLHFDRQGHTAGQPSNDAATAESRVQP